MDFLESANATKLYEIDKWLIGVSGINPISINIFAELHIEIGKKVVASILGVPIAFTDT